MNTWPIGRSIPGISESAYFAVALDPPLVIANLSQCVRQVLRWISLSVEQSVLRSFEFYQVPLRAIAAGIEKHKVHFVLRTQLYLGIERTTSKESKHSVPEVNMACQERVDCLLGGLAVEQLLELSNRGDHFRSSKAIRARMPTTWSHIRCILLNHKRADRGESTRTNVQYRPRITCTHQWDLYHATPTGT